MLNHSVKKQAIGLRKQGLSLSEISSRLSISKSITSLWLRETKLSRKAKAQLIEKHKEKSKKTLSKINLKRNDQLDKLYSKLRAAGSRDVGLNMSERDLFFLGIGLYMGEGYKKGNNEIGLTNSDPEIINIFIKFVTKIYKIKQADLILRIAINSIHKNRLEQVEDYWIKKTGIKKDQFTKSHLIDLKNKKTYLNHENYYGTIRVKVRNPKRIRQRILSSIASVPLSLFKRSKTP